MIQREFGLTFLVTGEDFTNYFPMFQGKGTNAKLQLPLPMDFFD